MVVHIDWPSVLLPYLEYFVLDRFCLKKSVSTKLHVISMHVILMR